MTISFPLKKMATMSPNRNPNEISAMEISLSAMEISISPPPPPPPPPLETYQNWLELPRDVTLMILMKLGPIEILDSVQFVCKLWYSICKEPSMWRIVHILNEDEPELARKHEKRMFNAVNRSQGGLIDVDIEGDGSDQLCSFIASRSSQLKRLRLACCYNISGNAVIEAVKKLTSLEELELAPCTFETEKIVSLINTCPSLTTFKLNEYGSRKPALASDDEALAIAQSMPQLQHLQLLGNCMTNDGLTTILDSCRHLKFLDLRACYQLDLVGDLGKRLSEQIKDFRLPYDSAFDFPNHTIDFDSDLNSDLDDAYAGYVDGYDVDGYDERDFISDDDYNEFSGDEIDMDDYFLY